MRSSLEHLSKHRLTEGLLATPQWAKYGTFLFRRESINWYLAVSDSRDPGATGWEHAAVLGMKDNKMRVVPDIWIMAELRDQIWEEEEPVALYFNRYMGTHFDAHLWRPPTGALISARPGREWATSLVRRWEAVTLGELAGRTEQLEIA